MYRILIQPYKQTALRHLDMADTLLSTKFHDGAAFHVYHAYESIICAALLKQQPYNMPPLAHPTKLNRFLHVFAKDIILTLESAKLSPYLLNMRNRVLYPELRRSTVIVPSAAISYQQVQNYLSRVKQFVNLVTTKLGI
ncbi:HEPN domain-containing protein [Candidatus Poribacteria bacterium]|nr:HEPN domain-containing protein [Candidatus Poribacteria bacterium]